MESRDNIICKDFENEVWLYLDQELSPTRLDFWNQHVSNCETCTALIDSFDTATSIAKDDLFIELANPMFDKMVAKVFTQKKSTFFYSPIKPSNNRLLTWSKLKYSLATGLIVLAFIFSFNITKQNVVRNFRNVSKAEEYSPSNMKLSQMVKMVYGNELDKQIDLIETQVNNLTIE